MDRTIVKTARAAGYKGGPSGWICDPDGNLFCQGWVTASYLLKIKDEKLFLRVRVIRSTRDIAEYLAFDVESGHYLASGGTRASALANAATVLARRDLKEKTPPPAPVEDTRPRYCTDCNMTGITPSGVPCFCEGRGWAI